MSSPAKYLRTAGVTLQVLIFAFEAWRRAHLEVVGRKPTGCSRHANANFCGIAQGWSAINRQFARLAG